MSYWRGALPLALIQVPVSSGGPVSLRR